MTIDRVELLNQRARLDQGYAANETKRNLHSPTSHDLPPGLFKPDELVRFQVADPLIETSVASAMQALGVTDYTLERTFNVPTGRGILNRRNTRVDYHIELDPDGSPFEKSGRRIWFWLKPSGEAGEVGAYYVNMPVPVNTSDHPNWLSIPKAIALASDPRATKAVCTGVSGEANAENMESLLKLILADHLKLPKAVSPTTV